VKFRLLLAGTFALATTISQTAYALSCGDTIMSDTTMTSDLGPCPAGGLIINWATVTLDLAGHKILGTGTGDGVVVHRGGAAIIKGPGMISNFGVGILVSESGGGVATIHDLVLFQNSTGITFDTSEVQIFDSFILGGTRGVDGIWAGDAVCDCYRNTITGHSHAGASLHRVGGTFDANVITANNIGIDLPSSTVVPISIQGNRILGNRGDGVSAGRGGITIAQNYITGNGGNGSLLNVGGGVTTVKNNQITFNRGYGIGLVSGTDTHIEANRMLGNGLDLYWSGSGMNNCADHNIFRTVSPILLPPC